MPDEASPIWGVLCAPRESVPVTSSFCPVRSQAAAGATSELEPGSGRAQVDDPGRADRRLGAPALVDVAADREPRALRLRSPRRIAVLPRWSPALERSTWPSGGEWTTSTAPSGQSARRSAASSSERSKLQSQGVIGTPAPSPKKAMPVDLGRLAVEHGRRRPGSGRLAQRVLGLVVAGDAAPSGASIAASASIVSDEPLVDRGEVAGADDDVGVAGELDQRPQPGRGRGAGRRTRATRIGGNLSGAGGRDHRLRAAAVVADAVAGVAEVRSSRRRSGRRGRSRPRTRRRARRPRSRTGSARAG